MNFMPTMHMTLTPDLIKRAEEELGETDETRVHGLKEMKRLIKDEPDFNPCIEDAFLLRFLRCRKYNIDRAFKTLKNYYQYKAQNSRVLTDLRPSDFSEDKLPTAGVTEYRDQNKCVIGIIRLGREEKSTPEELLGLSHLVSDMLSLCEPFQVVGYCLIMDMAGITLGRIRRYSSPTFLYKLISVIQETYPSRIKAFHVVNEPFYFDIFFNIMRTFMTEKLKKRFYFHGSNMESLHKHIDPRVLPEELGGEQGPSEIYEKKFFKILKQHEDYFVKMNKFGYTGKTLQKLSKGNQNAVFN